MKLFGRKKKEQKTYDRENKIPVIRVSICTGEKTAGFKDIHTGRFEEVMLIRSDSDLETFRQMYNIEGDVKRIY